MAKKVKSPDYRQGWGDCQASLVKMIEEAFRGLNSAQGGSDEVNPTPEQKRELYVREQELRRVRAMIRSLAAKHREE